MNRSANSQPNVLKKPRVFISYSRINEETWVKEDLCNALSSRNIDVDGDWKLRVVEDYRKQIGEKIVEADVVLFIISRNSLHSPECIHELDLVQRFKKRIIPILRKVDYQKEDLHDAIRSPQWVQMHNDNEFEIKIVDLVNAINTDFDLVEQHTDLSIASENWTENKRDKSLLLRGSALKKAEQWLVKSKSSPAHVLPKPTAIQVEFIAQSRKHLTTQKVFTLSLLGLALIIVILLLNYSINQTENLRTNQALQDSSKKLANNAIATVKDNVMEGLQLAIKAASTAPSEEANNALKQILMLQATVDPHDFYGGRKKYAVLNQAGWLLTIGEAKYGLRLHYPDDETWNPDNYFGGQPNALLAHNNGTVNCAAFIAGDDLTLVTGADDNNAVIWAGNDIDKTLRHPKPVISVACHPTRDLIATGCGDGLARVWSKNGVLQKKLKNEHDPSAKMVNVGFSLNGELMLSAITYRTSQDQSTIDLYTVGTWERKSATVLQKISAAALSPDGQYVMITTEDPEGLVTIWNINGTFASNGSAFLRIGGFGQQVTCSSYSPDGKYLAFGLSNGTIKLHKVDNLQDEFLTLSGQAEKINSITFSPDSKYLVSASADKTVFIRSLDDKIIKGELSGLLKMAKSRYKKFPE